MTLQEKLEIYQTLLQSLSKGVAMAAGLRERKAPETEIKDVERKNQILADTAAELRRSLMKKWRGEATTVLERLRAENDSLQGRVRRLDSIVDTAEHVVRFLGKLDDVIAIAAKLLV